MGGNALKDVGVVRLPARLYAALAEQVVARLGDGVLFPGLQARGIPAVRAKADFGDLDVLVTHPEPGWGFDAARRAALTAVFQPTRVVTNGPVLSFDVAAPGHAGARSRCARECFRVPHPWALPKDGEACSLSVPRENRFQVDLIHVPPDVFTFALAYFSYNDLGNLLGRVARHHGFKLGHNGLFRPLRAPGNESHFVRDVVVTRDWSKALQLLGYDPARWEQGFDTMDEMFAFVMNSRAFHSSAFPFEHRSHRARVRDRKRPTYTAFLQHLANCGLVPATEMDADTLDVMRQRALASALDQFEDFAKEWQQAQADLKDRLTFRQRFNGDVVRQLTGLDGAALGQHMRGLRARFSSDEALRAFVLDASDEALETFIRYGKT